ncbi:hypothetical protein ACFR97_10405 [Haloplanus litoreus]|uniref:C2H2-type domain-containing protein n=1 Tax=Haloplanus litoreus TaxID=767515 RepID=A0ABD6A351_9EURY
MAGCRKCGRRCKGRLCRDCERDERYADEARYRADQDDDDDEGEDPVPLPDGGVAVDGDQPGTFECPDCGCQVTRGPSGREYGHRRGTTHADYERCPRRSAAVDPKRSQPDSDLVTDGGRVHPADAALTHRGMGDQRSATCPNGSVECANPGTAPCAECFLNGGGEDA